MGFAVKMTLVGLEDSLKNLAGLKKSAQNRIMRPAITELSQRVLKNARQLAPKKTGALRKSLKKKVKTYKSVVVGIVGAAADFQMVTPRPDKRSNKPVKNVPKNYIHLVESGVKAHSVGGRFAFKHPGFEGRGFLRAALTEVRSVADGILQRRVAEGLEKYRMKQASRGK